MRKQIETGKNNSKPLTPIQKEDRIKTNNISTPSPQLESWEEREARLDQMLKEILKDVDGKVVPAKPEVIIKG